MPHTFSMGFRCGDFADQSRTLIFWEVTHVFIWLAMCIAALSHWQKTSSCLWIWINGSKISVHFVAFCLPFIPNHFLFEEKFPHHEQPSSKWWFGKKSVHLFSNRPNKTGNHPDHPNYTFHLRKITFLHFSSMQVTFLHPFYLVILMFFFWGGGVLVSSFCPCKQSSWSHVKSDELFMVLYSGFFKLFTTVLDLLIFLVIKVTLNPDSLKARIFPFSFSKSFMFFPIILKLNIYLNRT